MKTKTKDRLLTAGTVLLLCAVSVSLTGCATTTTTPSTRVSADQCTTDFDCEMHEARGTRHNNIPRWKMWTSIGVGVVITGFLYAYKSDRGSDQRGEELSKSIQPVTCTGACAQ